MNRPFVKWYTTKRCNSNCRHCFISANSSASGELTTGQARDMLLLLRRLGFELFSFGGAEPTMRDDIFELMQFARAVGFEVKIHTNGLCLDGRACELLAESEPFEVRLSLDGTTAATNDYVRGWNSYEKTLSAVRGLTSLGVPVSLATAWSRLNVSEAPRMAQLLSEVGVSRHHSYVLIDKGRAKVMMGEFLLTRDELAQVRDALRESASSAFDKCMARHCDKLPCRNGPTAFMEVDVKGDILFYVDSRASWGVGIERLCNVGDSDVEERIDTVCRHHQTAIVDCSACPHFATMSCIELDNYCVADLEM